MPSIVLSDQEAIALRRANDASTWPVRGGANRVEPLARPQVDPKFSFDESASIFVLGLGCAGRNFERDLLSRGYRFPMRDLFASEGFENVKLGMTNLYGAPSLYNELAWALDPEVPFVPEDHLLEVGKGQYLDLHLGPIQDPVPWDEAVSRREKLKEGYRSIIECTAILMTVGHAEVWYDTKSGFYLNSIPRPALFKAYPKRFELHVLSYEDVKHYLFTTLDLLDRYCKEKPKVALNVSPFPLQATHRAMDVMTANAYSKAVLRTVADEAAQRENVAYFPSFESITLSERNLAWMNDQVHVTEQILNLQLERMIDAYAPKIEDETDYDAMTLEQALETAETNETVYERCGERFAKEPSFIPGYVRYLLRNRETDRAITALDALPPSLESVVLKAQALRLADDANGALEVLAPHADEKQKSPFIWQEVIACHVARQDRAGITRAIETWSKATPVTTLRPLRYGARVSRKFDPAFSIKLLEQALAVKPDNEDVKKELATARERLAKAEANAAS